MLFCNLTSNNIFAPPGGLPFRLTVDNTIAQVFVPLGVTVSATIVPDYVADVHMALYSAHGNFLSQIDSLAVTKHVPAVLSMTPIFVLGQSDGYYFVRISFDNAVNGIPDSAIRLAGNTVANPNIPYGVTVTNFSLT